MALKIYDVSTDETRDAQQSDIDEQAASISYLVMKQQVISMIAEPRWYPVKIPCADVDERVRRIKMMRDIFLHGNIQKLTDDYPTDMAKKLSQ